MPPAPIKSFVSESTSFNLARRKPKLSFAIVRPSSAACSNALSSFSESQALHREDSASSLGWSLIKSSLAKLVKGVSDLAR